MAFPDDLDNVIVFKIHPAIGIARVSKSSDHFIFGDDPGAYKSGGLMKRQAVKFRVFAYGDGHMGLGELTPAVMANLGITPVWSAELANRKIPYTEHTEGGAPPPPLEGASDVVHASASSDDANGGVLTGSLPGFAEGATIPLGQITPDGVFIPPVAGVHRKTAGLSVPNYPNFTFEIADTTSDGPIQCRLDGLPSPLPVLPASVIVGPGDYSPDVDPPPNRGDSLLTRLQEDIAPFPPASGGTIHNDTARELDYAALRSCTGDFAPGFEVSFGGRGEISDLRDVFYRPGTDAHIAPSEIRVKYRQAPGGDGAVHGQLTSGLCSPWQTDFTACVGYWNTTLPTRALLDEDPTTQVRIYRKQYDDHRGFIPPSDRLSDGDDFEQHQDKVGVVRIISGQQVETERDAGDDI